VENSGFTGKFYQTLKEAIILRKLYKLFKIKQEKM
jgi:hypothetical protein